jgi:hypothetical protein
MTKTALVAFLFSLSVLSVQAQVFIGSGKNDVLTTMKSDKPDFMNDQTVHNDKYNYLKYISDDQTETWIIVFDNEEKCKCVMVTCEMYKLSEKRKELNELYTKRGDDKWSLDQHTGNILIDLKNETWYFTITYRPAPKL